MVEAKKDTFKHESILQKRWVKFKSLKRGYYSLIILLTLYLISFLLPLLINNRALVVRYNDKSNFYKPAIEYVENTEGIRKYGVKEKEVTEAGTHS